MRQGSDFAVIPRFFRLAQCCLLFSDRTLKAYRHIKGMGKIHKILHEISAIFTTRQLPAAKHAFIGREISSRTQEIVYRPLFCGFSLNLLVLEGKKWYSDI